jgi:shikimate kinase
MTRSTDFDGGGISHVARNTAPDPTSAKKITNIAIVKRFIRPSVIDAITPARNFEFAYRPRVLALRYLSTMAIVRQCIAPSCAIQRWDFTTAPQRMMIETERPELPRTLVLVGMMGAGKTAVGRRLSERLGLPFLDADEEIEAAAGCTIDEIFAEHGEKAFREGEKRVIQRLLSQPVCILATGGGAFMDDRTRAIIRENAISVWLRADLNTLWHRVRRRTHRPLLKTKNPRQTLEDLITARYPVYAMADITVESDQGPLDATADRVIESVNRYLATRCDT